MGLSVQVLAAVHKMAHIHVDVGMVHREKESYKDHHLWVVAVPKAAHMDADYPDNRSTWCNSCVIDVVSTGCTTGLWYKSAGRRG